MRSVRPAAVEKRAVERVSLAGRQDTAAVVGMDPSFRCRKESRPHPGACGAEREHGRETSSVGDSSGSQDRNRSNGVDHPRDERESRHGPPDVPAGLPSLRDDHVGSGRSRKSALFCSADGDEHDCPRVVRLANDAARVTPEERDDTHTCSEGRSQPLSLVPRQAEIDAERTLGLLPRLRDDRVDVFRRGPREGQHPEPTRTRHGGCQTRRDGAAHRRKHDRGVDADEVT